MQIPTLSTSILHEVGAPATRAPVALANSGEGHIYQLPNEYGRLIAMEVPWSIDMAVSGLRVAIDENSHALVQANMTILPGVDPQGTGRRLCSACGDSFRGWAVGFLAELRSLAACRSPLSALVHASRSRDRFPLPDRLPGQEWCCSRPLPSVSSAPKKGLPLPPLGSDVTVRSLLCTCDGRPSASLLAVGCPSQSAETTGACGPPVRSRPGWPSGAWAPFATHHSKSGTRPTGARNIPPPGDRSREVRAKKRPARAPSRIRRR